MSKHFKQGQRYYFKDQCFWAEGGLICLEDQRNGNFKAITRAEAAARAVTFNEELPYFEYPDERDEMMRCVVNLCEAIKEAKRQGDPTDTEVRKQLVKDRRKISVLMSPGPSSLERVNGQGTAIGGENRSLVVSDRFRGLKI